ncbi:hypothetical protein [Cytobacillus gottheilii]|uniref:Uncharacterized protein n=1 Tax=Cytobacillus gottheilii TaxID=859144 RepID=A0ABX8FEC2_9BACI|nr:hypothetical protein [Cytobacillus gottheilii]QVY62370.1 hypothetical protein J1899_04510 [Cytobacillus gottheilii]
MKRIEFLHWVLEIDVDKTKDFYKKEQEVCTCLDCENFRKACKYINSSVMELFLQLGVDPSKPSQLSEFGEDEDGKRFYIGNYHLTGKVVKGPTCTSSTWNAENTATVGDATIGFEIDLMDIADTLSSPVLQIGFEMKLPWVLKEDLEQDE